MKRLSILLLVLVGAELAVLALKFARPLTPEPPSVDLTLLGDRVAIETLAQMQQQMDRRDPEHWKQLGEYYLTYGYYPQAEMCFRVAWRMHHETIRCCCSAPSAWIAWAINTRRSSNTAKRSSGMYVMPNPTVFGLPSACLPNATTKQPWSS